MGWAIKRPDGTYRCWNGNAKDDIVQPGEVWEERDTPPEITIPLPPVVPNTNYFEFLLRTTVFTDALTVNALLRAYPLFLPALRGGAWPDLQAIVADAVTTGAITPEQHAAVSGAAKTAGLPVAL